MKEKILLDQMPGPNSLSNGLFQGEWQRRLYASELTAAIKFRPTGIEDGYLALVLGEFSVFLDFAGGYLALSRTTLSNFLRADFTTIDRSAANTLEFRYAGERIEVQCNGVKIALHTAYRPAINRIRLECDKPIEIIDFELTGTLLPSPSVPLPSKLQLHCSIDFFDDMIPMPWTPEMLERYMQLNARLGVRRIDWIYHGNLEDGFWDPSGSPNDRNYRQTLENFRMPFLPAAVAAAKKSGLEIIAVFKPFDMAFNQHSSRESVAAGKSVNFGGRYARGFNFPVQHPELCLQRRPHRDLPAQTIVLESRLRLPADLGFKLWVSGDNRTYRETAATCYPESDGHRVVFDIAAYREKFFAVRCDPQAAKKVYNQAVDFIRVYDKNGQPVEFTLGSESRRYIRPGFHLERNYDLGEGFKSEGFYFDFLDGVPTAVFSAVRAEERQLGLDPQEAVIGIGIGGNEYLPGCLCPSEPEVVNFWLKMIGQALDFGVDGVDIRVMNHHSILEWKKFGFNRIPVAEYQRRYGVDPSTEVFDPEKWRRLRGEFFTAFLRRASARTRNHGKKFLAHIEDMAFGSPDISTMMEIHWDYQRWLDENLLDEVTLKILDPDSIFSEPARQLILQCQARSLPVTVIPFIHCIADLDGYLKATAQCGINAFNLYEAATLWSADPNGFPEIQPAVLEQIRQFFRER